MLTRKADVEINMRTLLVAAAAATLLATPLAAQTAAPPSPSSGSPTGSSNPAVNPGGNAPSGVNASGQATIVPASALEKGSNSFTEGQVRSRLEGAGFTNVSDLKKDDDGIWRGKASRNGQSVTVGFDYKGNISGS